MRGRVESFYTNYAKEKLPKTEAGDVGVDEAFMEKSVYKKFKKGNEKEIWYFVSFVFYCGFFFVCRQAGRRRHRELARASAGSSLGPVFVHPFVRVEANCKQVSAHLRGKKLEKVRNVSEVSEGIPREGETEA